MRLSVYHSLTNCRHCCRLLTAIFLWVSVNACCSPLAFAEVLHGNFCAGTSGSSDFSLPFTTAKPADATSAVSLSDTPHQLLPHDSLLRIQQTLHFQLNKLSTLCGTANLRQQPIVDAQDRPVLLSKQILLAQSHWQLSSQALSVFSGPGKPTGEDSATAQPAQQFADTCFCGQTIIAGSTSVAADRGERTMAAATVSLLQPYSSPPADPSGLSQPQTSPLAVADSFQGTTEAVQRFATGQRDVRRP
jgi:hypothetical protein